ncbi:MAG: sugar ABC transporter ATP-binding protein [Desulfobacterales bacterium]|nr:MAG: sugar ABC transporter ATP-binding protein [Desulfobacterales bacterium]
MAELALEMLNIRKEFPGIVALDDVSFSCRTGDIHALVGENGAGKSTLMKILAGVYHPDKGVIRLEGEAVRLNTPRDAQSMGIGIIYQEFNLLPWLSVAENILIGNLPKTRLGLVDWSRTFEAAQKALDRLEICLDLRDRVIDLSVAQQQLVEIAKVLSQHTHLSIIIMDEPSAVLAGHELEQLFDVIRTLKEQGVTIIYISHRLDEVFEIAEKVTVLQDGQVVGTDEVTNLNKSALIRMMVGRTLDETFPAPEGSVGEIFLKVENLSSSKMGLKDINFSMNKGEILGLAGLVGAGRSELAMVLFGVAPADSGEVWLDNQRISLVNPRKNIQLGMALVPENRKEQGLVLTQSVRSNTSLVVLDRLRDFFLLKEKREYEVVRKQVQEMNIRTPSLEQEVGYLSGGNQQKVALGKWLCSAPKLIIMDEPTRGIDVGAKAEIYQLMRELANKGTSIIMISSELPEIIGMSDRILVMSRGQIAGQLSRNEASEERILTLAIGETSVAACQPDEEMASEEEN